MSETRAVRTLRLPPSDLNGTKIPRMRQGARLWFRVHQSKRGAIHFALRDIHRFSHPKCPYAYLYLGTDVSTCLFERFGDEMYDHKRAIAYSLWCAHSITVIKLPTMHICDLTNAKTLSALRADLSALMHNNLSAPQEWGLAIQQHPTNFQGIKFKSRFNGKACLALFNHDGIEKGLKETRTEPLANSEPAADWLDRYKVSLF